MRKVIINSGLIFVFLLLSLSNIMGGNGGKTNSEISSSIEEGNKLLSKGQFSAAIAIWQKLLESDASNANINFKLGLCYLNSFDEQSKALPYLRKASKNLSDKYDFYSTSEKAVPYDAVYFLAQSYLTNNLPDSALQSFFDYQDKYNGAPPIPVDRMIRNCIFSKNAQKNPRDVTMKNPGKNVNSTFSESNPVLTIDNSVMFFSSRRAPKEVNKKLSDVTGKLDEDIYYCMKDKSGKWEASLPFKWNSENDEAPLALSADGLTLYLRKEAKGQTDIYSSHYIDKVWSEPQPISEINTSANETGVSVSGDGKYLYFCSDKQGGNGHFDIYQCTKQGDKWGKPKNISNSINSSLSEISPFITPNGKTLFFSSNGMKDGMGGYDIYYSEWKEDGTWTKPENMGFPVNTTRDDLNYYIIGGGTRYYSTVRDEKDSYDIFKIEGGGFAIENIDAGGQVVTLTKEMTVTDVLEVQKTVEKEVDVVQTIETTIEVVKEVEKVDVEKEKMKMDSMLALARREVQADKIKMENERVQAEAAKAQAEAAIKTAEADKAKAEADKAKEDAVKATADAERSKQEAIKAKADAEKAKSDAVIAAAQKAKDDLARAKIEAETKKTEAAIAASNAGKARADADKARSEEGKIKAEADKAKAIANKANAEANALQQRNQLAENEKPKYEAQKAKAEADKAKAEADKAKSQEALATAQQAKDEATKAKAEAELAKINAAREKDQRFLEAKRADAEKAKADAEVATAGKAKSDADKAASLAAKAQADAAKAASDAQTKQAQAEIAAADKAKAEADKAASQATKAQADAAKAASDAEAKKAQLEILKLNPPKPKTEAAPKKK